MADPATRIVSLTVTEKGYCHTPQTGELDERHPDIVHDLAHPHAPRSAPGYLVAALARRKAAGLAPFTVLSCDNLSTNGHTVQRVLTQFAALQSKELSRWIEGEVACPSTMVDRIVPETTDADRATVAAALHLTDAWPVIAEPFIQWIIEDRFSAGRPDLAAVGAQFVTDVTPFEHMKLRLLNASHSGLAYLGYLAGYETIAATMADPHFAAFARRLMDDSAPTLTMPPGTDLATYTQSLLTRFANKALQHRTWQIAMDGSQKLPQRLLGTMRDRLAKGLPIDNHALAVAGWMRYVTGMDEQGRSIDVRDPFAKDLASIARAQRPGRGATCPGPAQCRRRVRRARKRSARAECGHRCAGAALCARRPPGGTAMTARVASIGECMVELRELPEGQLSRGFGGDTLNTAVYLARLGVAVDYVTALGDDAWSGEMLAAWQAEGIGTGRVQVLKGLLPGIYVIQTDPSGERRFLYWRDNSAAKRLFEHLDPATLAVFDVFYLSGITLSIYDETSRNRLFAILDDARARGARVVFDTNFRLRGWPDLAVARSLYGRMFKLADIILASTEDLALLYGETGEAELLGHAADTEIVLRLDRPASRVLCQGSDEIVEAAQIEHVVDTTAAGDSFAAAYLASRLAGAAPDAAARAGHELAGLVVGYPGAIVPRHVMRRPICAKGAPS